MIQDQPGSCAVPRANLPLAPADNRVPGALPGRQDRWHRAGHDRLAPARMPPSACASWHRAALQRDWQARWAAADRSRGLARALRRSHPQPGLGCFRPGSTHGRRERLDVGTADAAAV